MKKLLLTSLLCFGFVGFSAPGFSAQMMTNDGSVVPKTTTTAAVVSDQDIASQVKDAFKKDPALQKEVSRVTIIVKDKGVILTGKVSDKSIKDRFQEIAAKIAGVRGVANNLEVSK